MSEISFTIPNDPAYLKVVSKALLELANINTTPAPRAISDSKPLTEADIKTPPPPAETTEGTPPPPPAETTEGTPPPPPAENSDLELDAAGVPWDERIHAGTKSKVASGEWKKKRGVSDDVLNTVLAEITPAAETPAAVEAETPRQGITTFAELIEEITANEIPHDVVANKVSLISGHLVTSIPMLATRPDLIPAVAVALGL